MSSIKTFEVQHINGTNSHKQFDSIQFKTRLKIKYHNIFINHGSHLQPDYRTEKLKKTYEVFDDCA